MKQANDTFVLFVTGWNKAAPYCSVLVSGGSALDLNTIPSREKLACADFDSSAIS